MLKYILLAFGCFFGECVGVSTNNVTDVPFCDRDTEFRFFIYELVDIIVIISAVIGNTLCITVILYSHQLRKNPCYHFLVSLAFADLGQAVFSVTLKTDQNRRNRSFCFSLEMCYYFVFVELLFPILSAFHIIVIAVDRFVAVSKPFYYAKHFTRKKVKTYIIAVWLWCILYAAMGFPSWESGAVELFIRETPYGFFCVHINKLYYTVLFVIFILIPVCVSLVLYIKILTIAKSQAKAIAKLNPQNAKKNRKEIRATKVVCFVFASYVICYGPSCIILLLDFYTDVFKRFIMKHRKIAQNLFPIVFSNLHSLNCMINPYLYFLAGSIFRFALRDMVYKLLKKPRGNLRYKDETRADCSATVNRSSYVNKTFEIDQSNPGMEMTTAQI